MALKDAELEANEIAGLVAEAPMEEPESAPRVAAAPEPAPAPVAVTVAPPEPAAEPAPVVVTPEPEPTPMAVAPSPEPEPPAMAPEPEPEPAPVALAPEPEPAPVGESDLAPEPELVSVAEGFARFVKGAGTWKIGPNKAEQLGAEQYYAKIAMPLPQGGEKLRLSFKARSTGSGWAGLGIHVYARGVKSHKYYGEGRSLLVWFTSDPVHRRDPGTRLQIYRSLSDTYIADGARDMIADLAVPESLFATHEYRVDIDPEKGELAIFVDGAERGRLSGLPDFKLADTIALRALDKAEFSDFRAEAAR
jgi:hypothetical protein